MKRLVPTLALLIASLGCVVRSPREAAESEDSTAARRAAFPDWEEVEASSIHHFDCAYPLFDVERWREVSPRAADPEGVSLEGEVPLPAGEDRPGGDS